MKPTFSLLLLLIIFTSCSTESVEEAITKNSVSSEAQLQKMNMLLIESGNSYASNVKTEFYTTPKNMEMSTRRNKLFSFVKQIEEVDLLTSKLIFFLDQLKTTLLKRSGEKQKFPLKRSIFPYKIDLSNAENLSGTSVSAAYFIGPGGNFPSKEGLKLFNDLKEYRNDLVKLVGSTNDQKMTVTDINDYKNEEDLIEKIKQHISSKAPNYMDDQELLTELYRLLTLPNRVDGKHWVVNAFENSSLIGSISTLTILQNNILQARTLALAHISSRISSCNYGFDKIIPFAQGPSVIHEGDSAKITVGIAAFDSYNYPEVTIESASGEIVNPKNGTGIVILTPQKGFQKIKGTVSIRNKSGIKKTENWEWDIHVLPKK